MANIKPAADVERDKPWCSARWNQWIDEIAWRQACLAGRESRRTFHPEPRRCRPSHACHSHHRRDTPQRKMRDTVFTARPGEVAAEPPLAREHDLGFTSESLNTRPSGVVPLEDQRFSGVLYAVLVEVAIALAVEVAGRTVDQPRKVIREIRRRSQHAPVQQPETSLVVEAFLW